MLFCNTCTERSLNLLSINTTSDVVMAMLAFFTTPEQDIVANLARAHTGMCLSLVQNMYVPHNVDRKCGKGWQCTF